MIRLFPPSRVRRRARRAIRNRLVLVIGLILLPLTILRSP